MEMQLPLFNDDLSLVAQDTSFKPIYKAREVSDEEILSVLAEHTKTGSTKRMKTMAGECVVRLRQLDPNEVFPNTIDSSFHSLNPSGGSHSSGSKNDEVGAPPIIELQEFPIKPRLTPYLSYVNNLYVYIENVNLSNRTSNPPARNIAVEVKLMEFDQHVDAEGLNLIYAPGKMRFVSSYMSTVTYHSKQPQFYDEIKIALPAVLTPQHHLLFTFYHINVQPGKKGHQQQQMKVGYAIWPLLNNDK
jgi:hypothetical protein